MCGVAVVIAVNKGYPWCNLFGPVTHTRSWNNRLCKWLLLCKQRQGWKSIINELGDIDIHPHLISTARQPEESWVLPSSPTGWQGIQKKKKELGTDTQRERDDGLSVVTKQILISIQISLLGIPFDTGFYTK